MKSYTQTFSELYAALLQDIVAQYPNLREEMEMDLVRLRQRMSEEGLSFITITHLDMCDCFQQSLASGALDFLSSRPRGWGRKSSSDIRPYYLHGLVSLLFDEEGTLRSDPDCTAIQFVRQWLLMAKKLEVQCDESRLEAALAKFSAIEAELPDHHSDTWDLDDPKFLRRVGHPLWGVYDAPDPAQGALFELPPIGGMRLDWDLYRQVCDRFVSTIGVFDPFLARPKHGPGAVAEGDIVKYDFPNWPRKLQQYFPWDFFACADLGYYRSSQGTQPAELEPHSVVLAVPKTQKGPRIICKEPVAHMWMQGAVERFLTGRINDTFLSFSISLHDQESSRVMALEASASGDVATVDLSAASDRISTRLVEYLFTNGSDTSLLEALHATRSRTYSLNGRVARFRKFAPAGSACTFPVQSILFLSLTVFSVLASRRWKIGKLHDALQEVRVFGDDIIVPVDSIPVLYQVLSSCGLKVNESKSYTTGFFRESCGMDAYAGVDVTPAYVTNLYSLSRPQSLQSVVDASNNLFNRGFWHTSAELLKTVPPAERKLLPVGHKDGGAVSLDSFLGKDVSHLSSRFNEHLHFEESSALCITSRVKKRQSDGEAGLVQFFNEEPDPNEMYSSGQPLRPVSRKTRRWV